MARTRRRSTRDLNQPDEAVLFDRWHVRQDRDARDALIRRFVPLARRLAARYRSPNEPFDDLAQVAVVGLIGAIDRFDPERGSPFIAFAVPTILGELKRHFRSTGWAVHVPRRAQELSLRVAHAEQTLTATLRGQPTVRALAEYLELDIETVLYGLDASHAHHAASLDAPVKSASDTDEPETLSASIGCDDQAYDLVDTHHSLQAAISRLPYRERAAVTLRMHDQLRQVDIADRLQCSQMQVSRLLARAEQRLRDEAAI